MSKKILMSVAGLIIVIFIANYFYTKLPENSVRFGMKQCYLLNENEKKADLTQKVLDQYKECCFVDNAGLMLNRSIKADSMVNIYIGLSMESIPQDIKKIHQQHSSFNIIGKEKTFSTNNSALYHSWFIKKDTIYLNRIIYTEQEFNHTIVFDIVGSDSTEIKKWYQNEKLFLQKTQCN